MRDNNILPPPPKVAPSKSNVVDVVAIMVPWTH